MLVIEREFSIPKDNRKGSLVKYFQSKITEFLSGEEIPVRFVVTETTEDSYHCELGILTDIGDFAIGKMKSIFEFRKRTYENTDKFNAVMIVPTGIGAEIGGHAGDAGPAVRMMAAVCDTLITHPNAVNSSDIMELPENGLYVEGSVLTQLLMGTVGLQKVRSNRVMLVIDKHKEKQISEFAINSASGVRASLGMDCPVVVEMDPPIKMRARYSSSGCAVGRVEGLERLYDVLKQHRGEYDAVALASIIDVPKGFHMEYFNSHGEMVNPWGGVEAMLSHAVSMMFGVPIAHSPMMESMEILNLEVGVVDPRMAAEAVSTSFLYCILKGLHKSPRIISDYSTFGQNGVISASDISCLVIPDKCLGLPTLAALEQGIAVIAVRENKNCMANDLCELGFRSDKFFLVDNYLEAVGVMAALKGGVALDSVRRPLANTRVVCEGAKKSDRQEEAAGKL